MRGIKLLGVITGVGWAASYFLTATRVAEEQPVLIAAQALPAALIVGFVAWLFADKSQDATPTARPVGWTVIVIGALGFGNSYGLLFDAGLSHWEAAIGALASPVGFVIGIGVALLLLGKIERGKRKDGAKVVE